MRSSTSSSEDIHPSAGPILTAGGLDKLLSLGRRRPLPAAGRPAVHELVAAIASARPRELAVQSGGRSVDYGTLHAWAGRIAARLAAAGVGQGSRAGLLADPSVATVAAALGILRCGGAYVPIDPALPDQRISEVLADARVAGTVAAGAAGDRMAGLTPVLGIEPEPPDNLAVSSASAMAAPVAAGDAAYLIYTSGSTGEPKGVLVEHGQLAASTQARRLVRADSSEAVDPAEARARDRRFVWHPWTPAGVDRSESMLSHGDGYLVWDTDGREYIDASWLNAVCGYSHPDVLRAISRQWSYLGEERIRVVTFARGYHGSTVASRTLSGLPPTGHWLRDPMPVTHVELPVSTRELRRPESMPLLKAALERAIGDGGRPLAAVVEPFLNVAGGVVLPPGFLQAVREFCDAAGTLLVVDEVFAGYGRTGRMFACDREHVVPDILVSSKGLGSGYVCAVTVRQQIHDAFGKDPVIGGIRCGHPTSGHPAACAAALATLDVIDSERLVERAEELGAVLLERMTPLDGRGDIVDVRGLGLAPAMEMSSYEAAARLKNRLADNGAVPPAGPGAHGGATADHRQGRYRRDRRPA